MAVADRRERERLETRTKILDAARDLFVERGYENVSMRRIAETIEYSPTAIYVHFKDKEALFHEVCAHDFRGLGEACADLASVRDPIERIRQIGHAYMRFALEHPNHYRLMFMTRKAPPPPPEELAKTLADNPTLGGYGLLRGAVEDALAQDRFRPGLRDAELLAQTFWSVVHGVVSLQITMSNDPCVPWADLDARMKTAVDGILKGLSK
jgi:AcrR family transcriptional regulator